jgi:O6-methylguanine-DNA--protein-cysteine methyltransferase
VIASNGDIGGFSGGLRIKKALLELELKFTANNAV